MYKHIKLFDILNYSVNLPKSLLLLSALFFAILIFTKALCCSLRTADHNILAMSFCRSFSSADTTHAEPSLCLRDVFCWAVKSSARLVAVRRSRPRPSILGGRTTCEKRPFSAIPNQTPTWTKETQCQKSIHTYIEILIRRTWSAVHSETGVVDSA